MAWLLSDAAAPARRTGVALECPQTWIATDRSRIGHGSQSPVDQPDDDRAFFCEAVTFS